MTQKKSSWKSKCKNLFFAVLTIPAWLCFFVLILLSVAVTIIISAAMGQEREAGLPQIQILNTTDGQPYYYAYDGRTKGPSWVLEIIRPNNMSDQASQISTHTDSTIPTIIQNDQADFLNSGLDLGMLISAANLDTYRCPISIVSPQLPEFKRIYWPKIENYVTQLSQKLGVRVLSITGPLYIPHENSEGKRYVTYQVIGKNNVAVPTHFFKVIFYPVKNSESFSISSEAYIFPNQDINKETPMESFKTSLENLEKTAGIIFPKDKDIKPYIEDRIPMVHK